MASLPATVTVGAHTVTIELDPAIGDRGLNGETYRERCRIAVCEGLSGTVEREVVIHELFHMVYGGTALASADHPASQLEEQICHALAPPLLDLLRDNPDLLAYLVGDDA